MAALKYIEAYHSPKNLNIAKRVWVALRARVAPNSIRHRRELGLLLNAQGLTGQGVEVGVKEGKFSERILHFWKGAALFSIDPWREFGEDYRDSANVGQAEQDAYFQETQSRMARFEGRSRILRMTSEEAAAEFEDKSLDFAYLDAQHHYGAVKKDIAMWWPKIRRGGLLCGHDYVTRLRPTSTAWSASSRLNERWTSLHAKPRRLFSPLRKTGGLRGLFGRAEVQALLKDQLSFARPSHADENFLPRRSPV